MGVMLKNPFALAALSIVLGLNAFGQVLPLPSIGLAKYSSQCKLSVLKKIGWQVAEGSTGANQRASEIGCSSGSNAELRSQLNLFMPSSVESMNPRELGFILDDAFRSSQTQCVYQNEYSRSLSQAAKNLKSNHLYIFSPFWVRDNIRLGGLPEFWQNVACQNSNCFMSRPEKSAESLEVLEHSLFSSDCAVGLQLVEYSAVKNLFGKEAFNREFKNDEIFVGNWNDINHSKSFIHGSDSKRFLSRDGLVYARAGYRSFIGVTGIVGSEFGESYLDDKANRNENFIIVDTTENASKTFLKNGGLDFYRSYLQTVWKLTKLLTPEELQVLENAALWGKLASVTTISVRQALPPEPSIIPRDEVVDISQMLADPFLSDTKIYVHPFGLRSISWHILRLARLNPRTPYALTFYSDAVHYEIYDRWLRLQLEACEQ